MHSRGNTFFYQIRLVQYDQIKYLSYLCFKLLFVGEKIC